MNIVVECDTNNLDDGELDELARIVHLVIDGWHEWSGPDPDDDRMLAYLARNGNHRSLLEKSFTDSSAYAPTNPPVQVLGPEEVRDGDLKLPLRTARKFLAQPLRIFVENGKGDSAFIRALVFHTDPQLAAEILSDPNGPAQLTHGGGKAELLNQLGVYVDSMDKVGVPARAIVIVDSDSRYPGHVDADTNRVQAACGAYGFKSHILSKRAIENYMPDDVLELYADAYPDVQEAVSFICRLSDVQRDHYPMKRGLGDGLADGERLLYDEFLATLPTPKLQRIAEFWLANIGQFSSAGMIQRNSTTEAAEVARLIREVL